MNSVSLIKSICLVLTAVFIASCDNDFNELGSSVVDGDLHNNIIKYTAEVKVYDRPTGVVQTNSLPMNTLGVYNNPVFGRTTAHFVSQVQLATSSINQALYNPVIDSVWIYVPYRSTITTAATTDANGDAVDAVYRVDSVYSDATSKFRLEIKKNGFYLRDTDAGTGGTETQKYYSDHKELIEQYAGANVLKNDHEDFAYTSNVVKRRATYTDDDGEPQDAAVVETLAPGMFFYLKNEAFADLLAVGSGRLLNNSVFKEYFRGLYFKSTPIDDSQSAYAAPNFASGVITIKYTDRLTATDTTSTKRTLTLNLTGNSINLFENDYSGDFLAAINASNNIEGDNRIYLKGGAGSTAFLDIDMATLAPLMHNDATGNRVLINEANLVFYIDENTNNGMGKVGANGKKPLAPPRIYLYDVNNKRPVYDYYTDGTTISSYPKYNKYVHGGLIDTITNGGGRYRIRITDHINNLVNKDSTNIKLGLTVIEDIATVTHAAVKVPWTEIWNTGVPPVPTDLTVSTIPVSSVMHPFGTVLYGSNIPATDPNYDKRVRLEIFYTKPD
ncbi:DUF4270 family protein [Flavobacterium sp. Sd200]|uniref:DUF4270 domain-containing protein n=1 Tax=Flavobacterium sp. Sd200 TaxID=2692211 RepID=UPI0013715818|nr:DUF4270 domain-containing protein [Flavobacterium sp. Sd200]MXN92773.1 DUF4270 family protein [Flavobacterium sp. Sd200]